MESPLPSHIALLRAVNVGGTGKLPMAELKAMFASLDFGGARTLLATGNVVFDGGGRSAAALESLLETETRKCFGLATDYFLRTRKEWAEIVADNPFAKEAKADPSHLVAYLLKEPPKPAAVAALKAAIKGREQAAMGSRHLYLVYPDGIGDSRLTAAVIEKALGTRGTGRNWNTVLKLQALADG
jgi:uncharacterized protein (DUF1697 family)